MYFLYASSLDIITSDCPIQDSDPILHSQTGCLQKDTQPLCVPPTPAQTFEKMWSFEYAKDKTTREFRHYRQTSGLKNLSDFHNLQRMLYRPPLDALKKKMHDIWVSFPHANLRNAYVSMVEHFIIPDDHTGIENLFEAIANIFHTIDPMKRHELLEIARTLIMTSITDCNNDRAEILNGVTNFWKKTQHGEDYLQKIMRQLETDKSTLIAAKIFPTYYISRLVHLLNEPYNPIISLDMWFKSIQPSFMRRFSSSMLNMFSINKKITNSLPAISLSPENAPPHLESVPKPDITSKNFIKQYMSWLEENIMKNEFANEALKTQVHELEKRIIYFKEHFDKLHGVLSCILCFSNPQEQLEQLDKILLNICRNHLDAAQIFGFIQHGFSPYVPRSAAIDQLEVITTVCVQGSDWPGYVEALKIAFDEPYGNFNGLLERIEAISQVWLKIPPEERNLCLSSAERFMPGRKERQIPFFRDGEVLKAVCQFWTTMSNVEDRETLISTIERHSINNDEPKAFIRPGKRPEQFAQRSRDEHGLKFLIENLHETWIDLDIEQRKICLEYADKIIDAASCGLDALSTADIIKCIKDIMMSERTDKFAFLENVIETLNERSKKYENSKIPSDLSSFALQFLITKEGEDFPEEQPVIRQNHGKHYHCDCYSE